MLNKKGLKVISIGLIIIFMLVGFTSCIPSSPFKDKRIVFRIPTQEDTIDPALNESLYASTLIENSFEGLVRLDENLNIMPAVAKKWDISKDGKEYIFYLREEAMWSDGELVNANDFEFAWRRVLDKSIDSPYSSYMFCIKGAEEFFNGETKVLEGVEVLDDYTLKVTLNGPTPYFLELIASHAFMPVREDIVRDKSWASNPDRYVSNGPLYLTNWVPNGHLLYEKNENYWDKKNVRLDKLEVKIVKDPSEALKLFKAGKIDYMENPPVEEVDDLIKSGLAEKNEVLATYMYIFNFTEELKKKDPEAYKAISNKKVRQAFSLAINRKSIVENVTKLEEVPATSIVPPEIKDSKGNKFKDKEYFPLEGDVAKAKKLLAEAGYPEGKGFPEIEIMYAKEVGHEKMVKEIKESLKNNLGVDVKLVDKEREDVSEAIEDKDFGLCRYGWISDYPDPSSFFKLFQSNSSSNISGYSNPKLDELLEKSAMEADETKRFELYKKAEALIMDEMPAIPIHHYTDIICQGRLIKGVTKTPFGVINFYKGHKK